MTIPLDLSIRIHAAGLETFNSLQNAIIGTGEAARSKAAVNLGALTRSFQNVIKGSELLTPELQSIVGGMSTLSRYAGLIAPANLDKFADHLAVARQAVIESSLAFQVLSGTGATMRNIISSMSPEEQRLAKAIMAVIVALRNQATGMQTTTHTSKQATGAIKETTAATKWMGREARLSALTGLNVLSSVTQGVMMAMGALQGSIMSVGFGLIFLRYSIAPVTLGIAALVLAIGGTLKAISFVGPAFEKLVVEPMNRIKAAVVEAMGYFSGAVWVRIIAPSLQILADLADRFRDLALQTWLSADVQRSWAELLGMVQGTFQNLSRTIKEHGGILRWVVRTGFITAINVLRGLVYLINVAINVLPQLAYLWRRLSGDLKRAWSTLGLVAQGLKELGLEGALQKLKEFTLDITLEEILLLALGVLTGHTGMALVAGFGVFLADLMAEFLGFDEELREKWRKLWDWVAIGAFAGFVIGGPKGALIGAALGSIIGLYVGFKDEIMTLSFIINVAIAKMVTGIIDSILKLEDILDVVQMGIFPESMEREMRSFSGAYHELIGLHSRWVELGAPSLEGWAGTVEDLYRVLGTLPGLGGGGGGGGVGGIGGAAVRGFTAQWAEGERWTPSEAYGAALAAGAQAAQNVINVTITGNNMYGKLDDETARVWAQQLGFHTMSRLSGRYGIGLGG